jgi:hypothetical protein
VHVIGDWWNAFQGWYVWQWQGWVALGAIGTVGALAALYVQTRRLGQQLKLERGARRDDERERRETLQRANTPYLSIEGALRNSVTFGQTLSITAILHADGNGVAHNIVANIFRRMEPEDQHMNTPQPIRYMRAGGADQRFIFECDMRNVDPKHLGVDAAIANLRQDPLSVRVDISFLNQFDQQIQFTQHGKVEVLLAGGTNTQMFVTTDPPSYKWPCDIPESKPINDKPR